MKNAPAAVVSFVNSTNVAWHGDLYTLTLVDGTVYRWTDADVSLVFGGHTYVASGAVLRRSSLRQSARLEVDTLLIELSGAYILSGGKTIAALAQQGAFDEARFKVDLLVGNDPLHALSLGPIQAWFEGRIAPLEDITAMVVRARIESDLESLGTIDLPRFRWDPACQHAVYDPNCTLNKATFTDAATVSNDSPTTTLIPSRTAALIARAADYYDLGMIKFTSGALSGIRRAVKVPFVVSGGVAQILVGLPLPQAPAVGDGFSIYPGCARTQSDCNVKFGNLVNFRGFPHVPTTEGGE